MILPSRSVAARCRDFVCSRGPDPGPQDIRLVELTPNVPDGSNEALRTLCPSVCAVIFPKEYSPHAKTFWQHSGDGVSSRRAEFCRRAYDEGLLGTQKPAERQGEERKRRGPKRYNRAASFDADDVTQSSNSDAKRNANGRVDGQDECQQFIEERFGRNLSPSFASNAKLAIRRRIAGSLRADVSLEAAMESASLSADVRRVDGFSEDDVYLHPTGMSSIFNTHRALLAARGPLKSICYGFPYIDTLKILEKWGPGCLFYGHGSSQDLDDLEARLVCGERYLALFCEYPGNPLLKCPDLPRIRALADKYDFAVIVDETIGNFINVHVLPFADVVVSSLTKVFSGDSNVMGGRWALLGTLLGQC